MSWPKLKLESLSAKEPYSFVGGPFGSKLTTRDYVDSGIPVIRGSNMNNGRYIDMTDFVFVTESKVREDLSSNLAKPGDLIFTQRGTLGQVAIIPRDGIADRYVVSQSQMKLTVDEAKADRLFLYYFFSSREATERIMSFVSSSGVPHINLTILRNFEVPVPSPEEQREIARILSTYDDLIENNRRRIQLLEQAARLLYKEWFVHLRFPGHEHTRIIDGVPEGWERSTLENLCEHVSYGYTASAKEKNVGPKFLRITDIVPETIDWEHVPHCEINESKLQKFLLHEGDIVVARTGATVGYAKRIGSRAPATVFASYLVRFRFGSKFDNVLGGIFMESDYYKSYVRSNISGAAQPNANAHILGGAKIIVPPTTLQRFFRENTEPIFNQRNLLQEQNQKLAKARDLLLPKLMNGEVAV